MSMIGKTLATFTLEALLGKGGMGEVYQAKDQKLGRDVAIKVLPEEFAKDADRVARFQREAKLLASLNHPNIAAIHGLEESDGTHFLVLELIEGDTLADRLKRGAIPVEEALKLALQIAEALEAAHEKGVIHRDLKPANIKVTPDGKVKVLDFGLAKAFAGEQAEVNLSHSPTLSEAATLQGVILGTAAYMSPEQARGKPVDKRTDIWAFGCVLYEMLTGQSAFQGEDVSVTLASVINGNANLTLLPPSIHPRLREVVNRCLQKEQKKRYPEIGQAQYEIEQVLADPSGIFVQPVTGVKPRKKMRVGIPWVAAIFIFGLIIAGFAVWYLKPTEPRQVFRFDYDLPPEIGRFTATMFRSVDVSPDGTNIVYVADNQLYLKNANEFAARPIQGTDEDPLCPFFSPDGRWIGYFCRADNQLKKITVMGGASVTLCKATPGAGATWGKDDMIVFGQQGAIMRVSASGGTPEEIIKGEDMWLVFPQILPDGRSVLFTIGEGSGEGALKVAVQSFGSEEPKKLFAGGPAQYVPTGHIVYGLENNLVAVRFDLDTLEPIGGPVPLIEGVFRGRSDGPTHSAISNSGTLIYIPGATLLESMIQRTLVWVDREGKEEPLDADPNDYCYLKISPDGTQVALTIRDENGNEDIHIWDIARKNMMKLTFDEENDSFPLWTPDSKRIVFLSNRNDSRGIYIKNADGTGEVELLSDQGTPSSSSWSEDGKILVLGMEGDIGMLSMEGDQTIELLLQEEHVENNPMVSPDGRWLAYQSDESGQSEIYVRPFPDVNGGKWKVSTSGGWIHRWSWDGRELFYWTVAGLMAATVESEPTFNAGTPKVLLQRTPVSASSMGSYGISWDNHPDGKRFLMIKPPSPSDDESAEEAIVEVPREINIVLNWFEELKERVPLE